MSLTRKQEFWGEGGDATVLWPCQPTPLPTTASPYNHQQDTHLEDLHDDPLVVGDVDGLEDLAVLPSPELSNQLVVVLIAAGTKRRGGWGGDN